MTRHHFQGQKVKGQLVADVLNSQHAGKGAIWRINTKILSTSMQGRRHTVSPRAQLVLFYLRILSYEIADRYRPVAQAPYIAG